MSSEISEVMEVSYSSGCDAINPFHKCGCILALPAGVAHSRCSVGGKQRLERTLNRRLSVTLLHRVEDHDDLMPIFMHYDNTLREIYGEYFLAELIEAQDEENHAVVCEVGD